MAAVNRSISMPQVLQEVQNHEGSFRPGHLELVGLQEALVMARSSARKKTLERSAR